MKMPRLALIVVSASALVVSSCGGSETAATSTTASESTSTTVIAPSSTSSVATTTTANTPLARHLERSGYAVSDDYVVETVVTDIDSGTGGLALDEVR